MPRKKEKGWVDNHSWVYTGDKEWYCAKCGAVKTAWTISKLTCRKKKKQRNK